VTYGTDIAVAALYDPGMRYRRLGDTSPQVSVLALGCGNFGGIGSLPELFGRGDDRDTAFTLMGAAREHGITLLDTANAYGGGTSEEWVGHWLASRRARDDVVLTTKVRNRVGSNPADEGLSARHIREQVDANLRRLGTDRVDLYLAHPPDPQVPIEETLSAFDELAPAGKVRHTGLSNYTGATLRSRCRGRSSRRTDAGQPAVELQPARPLGGRRLPAVRRAWHRVHRAQPAGRALVVRQVPRRAAVPRGVTDDAAARAVRALAE
jgi:aryl-alcohol dehydrogenase-like predicted oxidoreductase